jgi:hypothetical protein
MLHIVGSELESHPNVSEPSSTVPESVEEWFEFIRPDFAESNVCIIAGAKKLIAAKATFKRRKDSQDTFTALVGGLGLSLDKAERLMVIARHPVLSDSANLRSLPVAWTTLFTLSKISPEALAQFIAEGKITPDLEGKEAERLVEQARGQNSKAGKSTKSEEPTSGTETKESTPTETEKSVSAMASVESDEPVVAEGKTELGPNGSAASAVDVGADSRSEIERKLARAEELERQARQWEIQKVGFESEVEELRAKLGETPIRHQRRLFRNALEAMRKAETSDLPAKEKRSLHNSAIIDLTELVRSLARDGIAIERLDLFCRPELH